MYMRTRLLSLFALLFLAHNAIAQLTSLGLTEETHCTVKAFVPLPLLEVSDNYLYASTSKGLYRYALDGTGEWSLVLATDKFVSDYAVRGDTVIVTTTDLLYVSYDGGAEVTSIPMDTVFNRDMSELVWFNGKGAGVGVHPYNAKHFYVGHSGGGAYTGDGGQTWRQLNQPGHPGSDFSYNPLDTLQIVGYADDVWYGDSDVRCSIDGGMSWTQRLGWDGVIIGILFHPTDKDKVIAYGGVYYMTDGSLEKWNRSPSADTRTLMDVVYDPYDPEILYGITSTRVKRSTDGGYTWSEIYNMQDIATTLVSIAIHDHTLYICTSDKGVYAFDLTAAAISPVVEEASSLSPYYDLMGRPVANPTRGIYIKDGKKIAVD